MKGIIKRATGYDAYGYISSAINARDTESLDKLLNSPPPTGYKGTKDLQEAAKKVDKSLLDLAFEAQDKKIIKKILRSECANLHSVSKETSHSGLANILLQARREDREELFQIIKDRLTKEDYCALLQANEVTDLLPRLFDLGLGVDQETVQAMFEEAVISGYQKAAFLLFNRFPEIDLSFKADIASNINSLEDLIDKLNYYDELPQDSNDDKTAIKDLLNLLLKQGDLSELDSNLLSDLFSGSETSSDIELIKSLLKNNTYTLEQDDVKGALDTIAGFEEIPATARILIRHVLKMWKKDNLDDFKSISESLVSILSKMKEEDKMREVLSLILQKDLVTEFISIKDYSTLCTHLMEQHGKKGSIIKSGLEYAKIIMAHCFWRRELSPEKDTEDKFDREQVNLLWKKLQGAKDKEILKLALKSEVLNVDAVSLDDKNVFNLYGIVNLFKSSLNKDIALFRAFAGYQDPEMIKEMIKGLIRNKGFKIESEAQFADELLRATDEIFHVSISELQKKGMLSEKLFIGLVQKISAKSTPSYKKHEILFNINPELANKTLQRETKLLNLLALYKDGCSVDYIQEISSIKGLAIQQTDNNKNTLVHAAAACGVAEDVRKALEFTGIEINTKNNQGFTPLMLLCASSTENKVAIADIIINHKSFGWSKELKDAKSNHLLLSYLADKDGFAKSNIAEYLLSIPEIATKENIRDLLLVALADGRVDVIFPDSQSIDAKLSEVRDGKSFLQDAIASNTQDVTRQGIVHRLIDETTISHEELPSVMFEVYKRCISSNHSNNIDLESYKISSLIQIAEKLGTDVNVQRVERMFVPSEKQSELYVHTSILGLACVHGAEGVAGALMQLKDIDLNCGTKANDKIPAMSPIMIAYSALRNNQETAKSEADIAKDIGDLNKPYVEIIKALLEKEGLDLTKEFAPSSGNISIAELLYSDPVLSEHESTSTIRKNIIENICKSQEPSVIKDHLLMLASESGDMVSVQTLLDNGASPLAKNEYGCHALAIAAINFAKNPKEYSKVIELLTNKVSIEAYKINEKDKTGSSTAHYVAAHCDLATVKKILGGIGASDFKGDSKLLIGAYSGGDANVIEYISGLTQISDEVLKTIKDAHGNTALHYVAGSDNPGTDYLLKSLIERGLDVNASNNYGVTPLMNAVVNAALSRQVGGADADSQIDKIGMLLASKELDPNAYEKNGNTALMIACQCGDREVIRSILNDSRVNINQTNAGMNSALMITAYGNRDQKISNIEDTTAALQNIKEKAEWECDKQIVADLIRRGADPLFGKNSESFTSRMLLIMIKTSLLTLANHFLLKFNPVLQRAGSVGIAWNTAAEVGSATQDLVTNKIVEYIGENKIDLKGFPIVGNYHVDKFGRVISGDGLKKRLDKAPQYINAQECIVTAGELKKAAQTLNSTDKFEIHNDLVYKYQHIQNILQNSNLLPWTRRGLEMVVSEIVKADRVLGLAIDQGSQTMQVQDLKNNFKYLHSSIKKQNRQATIDLMLKDDAIDLGANTAKVKEDFKDLLQKIVDGEIIADAKMVHNAKAFLDEYQKAIDSMRDTSLFTGLKLKIKDLLKKIIPGMKPSKELLKSALASIANDSGKEVNERVEKLKIDHENAIKIAKSGAPEIGVFPALDKEDGIFSSVVDYSNKIFGKNIDRREATEKLARSLGMLANIGGRLATFTAMEKDLTLGVMSPLLYYGATTTALSVAGIGGGIAAAAYGVYQGAQWLAGSGAQEVKVATNIADECSAKARQVFASHLPMTKYEGRKTATLASKSALGDEEVSNADLSYLDLLLGDATAQEQNMPFKDRIAAEQQRLTQQSI